MKKNLAPSLLIASAFALLLAVQTASGHVTVRPRYSAPDQELTYTIRVPTEGESATIRIEMEFPTDLMIVEFEPKDGWTIDPKRNADGKIVGAIWSGGSIAPEEAETFNLTARNPAAEITLAWKAIQTYEDGSRREWIGERGSRSPAPVTSVGEENQAEP